MQNITYALLEKLQTLGIEINEEVRNGIEEVLDDYTITPKSTELAIVSDLPDMCRYFLSAKALERVSNGTLANYRYFLRSVCENINKPASEITVVDLRKYLAITTLDKKESTVNIVVSRLKTFFTWLVDEGFILNNPSKQLTAPRPDKNLRKGLDDFEVESVRNSCDGLRERAIIEFLLGSGCRASEAVKVKFKDVLTGEFTVFGKGRKERTVLLSKSALFHIKAYIEMSGKKGDDLLISNSRDNSKGITVRSLEKIVKKIGDRCGLHLIPHLFRHTFATRLLNSGASLKTVQILLGHTTASTTEIYAKASPDSIKAEFIKYAA